MIGLSYGKHGPGKEERPRQIDDQQEAAQKKNRASLPYHYQSFDFEQLRGNWSQAVQDLQEALEQNKDNIDWQEFATEYSLPPDWDWEIVRRRILEHETPEEEFNDLLRSLYRAEKENRS